MAREHFQSTDLSETTRHPGQAWIRAFTGGRRVRDHVPQGGSTATASKRNWLDVSAAWNRWHEPGSAAGFEPREQPFFLLFDRVRVESLASTGWPGMASNLADADYIAPSSPLLRPLYLCARHLAHGKPDAARAFVAAWAREHRPDPLKGWIASWRRTFGNSSSSQTLGRDEFDALEGILGKLLHVDAWKRGMLEDAGAFADEIRPLIAQCGKSFGTRLLDPYLGQPSVDQPSKASVNTDSSEEEPEAEESAHGQAERESAITRAFPEYKVYNHAQDETALATRWYQPSDRASLTRLQAIDQRRARQLAHRLQRRLQVARQRTWTFEQDEGLIDSRRLARLVATDNDSRVFRRESESLVPEAGVSLLVDLSGSMNDSRRVSAALAIDLSVHVLETCGIQCEVLGYTTGYGENNPIERSWQRAKWPEYPGRMNAIRHIVFKGARQPWRRCRPYLGLLLREDFGHENIDGEALHWASQRLFSLDVSRRILVVLSDGAPFDQATASANGREYLNDHLRAVIERLEASPVQLLALGVGSEVGRFYRRAVVLEKPETVAENLFEHLGDLLTDPTAATDLR